MVIKSKKIKRKRVGKKSIGFLRSWWQEVTKAVKKDQRRCLRYKKHKNKKIFCFIRALLNKYLWQTMITFIIVIFISLFVIMGDFQKLKITEFFGQNLQTSLISQLQDKINSLTGQISSRKKCTEDGYWKPLEENICNYWLYQQTNKNCAKFNVPIERVAIGSKICCKPLDESVHFQGDKKNVTACPGSDIFFHKTGDRDSVIVREKVYCSMGACQFYPTTGFHIKMNEDGTAVRNADGQVVIEKDCKPSREVGPCSKDCGGGERVITTTHTNCTTIETLELCNLEPCYTEIN